MAGRRIEIQFLGKDVSAGKTADQVSGKFGKMSGKLQRAGDVAGKLLVGGLVAGGAAMVKFGNQAADLAETQSKVNQIFGERGAAALDKFAQGAASAMGMSKQAALDASATFGIIGKSAGLSGEGLVGFSKEMTTLAGDMASFNNTTPEEAIVAIGAAMRGEQEPIRRFGVLLDDATLRASAMRLGLIKTTKEALTPQQKALAAQAEILRQTKDQQGDFARTSDSVSNKQKIMKARFEDLTTQLGQKALPVMSKVTEWAIGAIDWMGKHEKLVKGIAVAVVGFTAAVWGINAAVRAWTAVQTAFNLVMSMNPIGLVVIAIAALVAGLILAYKKSETFRDVVDGAFKAVGDAAKWMWEDVLKPTFRWLINAWLNVAGWLIKGAAKAFGWVPGIGPKLKTAAEKFEQFKKDVNAQLDGVKPAEVKVKDGEARRKVNAFKEFYLTQIGKMNDANVHVGTAPGTPVGRVGNNARGTRNWRGGPTWVGERGPEIMIPPRGSAIIPSRQSMAMAGGGAHFTATQPLVIQMDGKNVWQGLLKVKRDRGGLSLGLA